MPEITTEHMTKVRSIARKVCGRAWRHWLQDVEGAGMEALVVASRDFDGHGTWEGYVFQRVAWRSMDELDKLIGDAGGSRNARSALSFDQLYTNWLGHDNTEE